MAPLDRRRDSPYTILLALLFLLVTDVSAAVLGLDFGTLNLKATLVKPGVPLDIVLTKDSKRKEAAAVAFKPTRDGSNKIVAEVGSFPERLYGGDALALQGRMPGEVFPNLKPLLGLPWSGSANEAVEAYKARYPAVQAQQVRELGTTVFKSGAFHDSEMPWSVEELLAMEFVNVRHNAEAMAGKGSAVEDAVITVPAFYTADERRAIEKAADLAGLNVMSLISDGLAVGLDYAKSRTFPTVNEGGKPEHHIVFDMGAGSTTATVLRFQGRSVKDVGRYNKTVQEIAVLGTGWDRTLGGDSLNQIIVQDYIHKFLTKPALKSRGTTTAEISKNGRLMSRLLKEAEKARQVLSANTETSSGFEELLPEIDFRTKLTRADFESLASSLVDRVADPINDALAAAKLKMSDIDSIILHGGAVRTPFVQRQLEKVAGSSSKLRSNVNADESAVFGAAFKAAGLSPSFKVKEIRDSDVTGYAAGMTYNDGKDRRQSLFSATSPVGNGASTKQISFKNKEDFEFGLYQQVGEMDRAVSAIRTNNLTESVAALKEKFGCEKEDVSTKFNARLSSVDGLPEIVGGTVSCETDQAAKGGSVGDSVKDWLGFGKKKDQEPLSDEDGTETTESVDTEATTSASSGDASSSTSSASSSTTKAPEKPKKRTESINIAFTTIPQGIPQPAPEETKRMRDRLAAFDRSDKARYAREEALNVLESFTYYVRDFLDNTDFTSVSTAAQREEISKLLASTREFMESPSDVAKATEKVFKDKLAGLKDLVTPIQQRRKEGEARPEKVKALRESLEQTNKLMEMVRERVKEAEASSSKASELEEASKSAASASSTTSAPSDDLDDLEEPDTSSTTEAPKYTSPASFSPYTSADLTSVEAVYSEITAWLAEKEAEQGKLSSHDDPVLTVKELEGKAQKLSEVMVELVQKKMRTPPKSSSSKKAKTSKTKKGKSSTTTEAPDASATASKKGGPKFMTVNGDEGMPSEEEILRMVREAKGEDGNGDVHDEL